MSLERIARNIFFGTEILGTMPTLRDSHSSNFACNIVSNKSKHAPPIGSVASDIGSVFPYRSVGALHPTVVSNLQPFIGSILPTSEAFLEPILGAHARCEVCTIPRDDHTMTPPPKHLNCKKKPNSPVGKDLRHTAGLSHGIKTETTHEKGAGGCSPMLSALQIPAPHGQ